MSGNELERAARAYCASHSLQFDGKAGEGAFKETFAAVSSQGQVAVKVYRAGLSSLRSDREHDAMRRCDHRNIGRVLALDFVEVDGLTYLVTVEEFLSGGTLGKHFERNPEITREGVVTIARQLIDAVSHIAERRLVHRDIKPDNVMLRQDGRSPVIVDFGLVRDLGADSLTQSWQAQGPGTPYFAPPEQILNEKHLIDWRADQFALGVTLSVLYLGLHPYAVAPSESRHQAVERVCERSGPSPQFSRLAEERLMPQLIRMVQPWPAQRYRTPQLLAAAWNEGA